MRSRPTDSPARRAYRAAHSEIRRLARSPSSGRSPEALRAVLADRAFWHGDRFSRPASAPARAALRALETRSRADCLELVAGMREHADLRTFLRLRHGVRGLWTAGRVRLPGSAS
jgi:hypothetical protein